MQPILLLTILLAGANAALDCSVVPGNLKQIDAGDGAVYGAATNGTIWRWSSGNWVTVPGEAIHVSVGPAGVWSINKAFQIYKLQDSNWANVAGSLKQVDAGGNKFVSGANSWGGIYCLSQPAVLARPPPPAWVNIAGSLKYYSCGSLGCWGANALNAIYYRSGTSAAACAGSGWTYVAGSLVMVEASTDGRVYGVDSEGVAYQRDGITAINPMGTKWTALDFCSKIQHVSFDSGFLWLINQNGNIYKCQDSINDNSVL
ncbi:fish-egg lectin-like [Ambystoma mexicanum]|uniref:fish-egg lectin-like n=1 Tax=Ambystoma mexicanum TaxID=8296 RepID=UPI0037E82EFB